MCKCTLEIIGNKTLFVYHGDNEYEPVGLDPLKLKFEDVVRIMPTDMLKSTTACNSIVDMWKYSIGSNELAFRDRIEMVTGQPYQIDKMAWEEFERAFEAYRKYGN